VYNAEKFLPETIESVLGQTFGDFEFILVNDGSKDASLEVLQKYAEKDQRIRVVSRENRGIVATRNEALSLANGEFVAILDADDVCAPQRLEKQVAYLRQNPDCVAVGCRVMMIDPEGRPIRPWCLEQTHDEIDRAHLEHRGPAILHSAALIRRGHLAALGYRKETEMIEDLDIFLRLAERGRLANLPEVLVYYRQHPKSICHTRFGDLVGLEKFVLEDTYRRRGLPRPAEASNGNGAAAGPRSGGSTREHHEKWAWWALQSGNVATARKYATSVLREAPFSSNSWRLLYCALRGR